MYEGISLFGQSETNFHWIRIIYICVIESLAKHPILYDYVNPN